MGTSKQEFDNVLNVSDEQVLEKWSATFSKFGSAPDDIRTEVVRRSVCRLFKSSRRLERLTLILIFLTIVLLFTAIPPAAETISHWRSRILQSAGWGLPIKLGQTSGEVRQVLGIPNEIVNPNAVGREVSDRLPLPSPSVNLEYYYSSGIVGRYDTDKLLGLTLNPYSDYKGFIPYSGTIVNGIQLTDGKDEILRKLGKETKIEQDPLEVGTDRDKPVVWPAESRYYWRRMGYTVQVNFLRQAQSVSEDPVLIRPKHSVSVIQVYK